MKVQSFSSLTTKTSSMKSPPASGISRVAKSKISRAPTKTSKAAPKSPQPNSPKAASNRGDYKSRNSYFGVRWLRHRFYGLKLSTQQTLSRQCHPKAIRQGWPKDLNVGTVLVSEVEILRGANCAPLRMTMY